MAISLNRIHHGQHTGGWQTKFLSELWPKEFVEEPTGRLTCGTGGWLAIVSPSGKRLAWREGYPDSEWLSALVQEGLEAWQNIPEVERDLGGDLDPFELNLEAFPEAPHDGLVLAAYVRALRRNTNGKYERIGQQDLLDDPMTYPKWAIDNTLAKMDVAWFTHQEWKSLIAETLRIGDRIPMNPMVSRTLIRHHLVDLTPNNPVRSWDEDDIEKDDITLVVEQTDPVVRLRVEGSVRLSSGPDKDRFATNGLIDLGEGKTLPARSKRYEADVSGILEYDPITENLTRFDIVVVGNYTGSQEEAIFMARPGSNPLGVAFSLADPWQREILWPSVIDDNEQDYCNTK